MCAADSRFCRIPSYSSSAWRSSTAERYRFSGFFSTHRKMTLEMTPGMPGGSGAGFVNWWWYETEPLQNGGSPVMSS